MPDPVSKRSLFVLVATQSIPTTFFLTTMPFFLRERFHWGAGRIGLCQALAGLCVVLGSLVGGRLAQRKSSSFAFSVSLRLGIGASLLGGLFASHTWGFYVLVVALFAYAQANFWPAIEAALMDGEPLGRVHHLTGVYNVVWSLSTSVAFFVATPLMARFGLEIVFWVPIVFFVLNLLLVRQQNPSPLGYVEPETQIEEAEEQEILAERRQLSAQTRDAYRKLAWFANPLSYFAINAILTLNPITRQRLGLSFGEASLWLGLWFYIRGVAFEVLRRWNGWHYRWGFLCGGFGTLSLSFLLMVLAPNRFLLLLAQVLFGLSAGLIYQSSLFYSMAESETSGEHGGIHEALIGMGNMMAPLVIFLCSILAPQFSALPVLCVAGVLLLGLGLLLRIGWQIRATEILSRE
jgi:MFS family permease